MSSNERQAVILFADLVGSARLSDIKSPAEYDEIVAAFQDDAVTVSRQALVNLNCQTVSDIRCDADIRGDQLVFIAVVADQPPDKSRSRIQDVAKVLLELAINLSVRWFFSDENQQRIRSGATPIQLGIGIHSGTVIFSPHWRFLPGAPKPRRRTAPEGFAINFAKRVESMSRFGSSTGITLSQSFVSICKRAGFPLFLSGPLAGETKGFEAREPIYELLGQELVPSTREDDATKKILTDNQEVIQCAFRRDPERTRWLLEMTIEALFWSGYETVGNWQTGKELALEAAGIVQRPARFYFHAGRCSHKLGWNHKHEAHDEGELLKAVAYHSAALADPDMQWAATDLVILHSRFASAFEGDNAWKQKPTAECAIQHLEAAKKVCDNLVQKHPDHFYSYLIRALIGSLLVQEKLQKQAATDSLKELLCDVERDLKTSQLLNSRPKHLYYCVQTEFFIAHNQRRNAESALVQARIAVNAQTDETIASEFLQEGVVVPGFRPPPRRSFDKRFEVLGKKIALMAEVQIAS